METDLYIQEPETKLTEGKVVKRLWLKYGEGRCEVACPNGYIYHWESDLLVVSKTGYTTEYEVKLSKADFKNDAKKRGKLDFNRTDLFIQHPDDFYYSKYESLVKGHGPNRFFYVFPEGMIPDEIIPEWAGIMEIGSDFFYIKRNPKVLHKEKVSTETIKKINTCLYYKVFNKMKWK